MLGKIHFVFGILVILLFLGTGQYMDHYYGHLHDMELMNRALFRAGHLYILLFGLIHVALGARFSMANRTSFRYVQVLGSVIMLVSTGLVVGSFFTELPTETIERPLARISLYGIFLGVGLHGILPKKMDS